MNNRAVIGICLAAISFELCTGAAFADIVEIGEFVGTHSEEYDDIPGVSFQELPVMDGLATLFNLTDGGAIKIEPNSTFNSDTVLPKSNPKMMGQLGILKWEFSQGVTQFGSFFENNSGTDDAVIEFFDKNDVLMGTFDVNVSTSAQQWTWNGWESDTPFTSIIVTGNSDAFLNGFIWYDNTQATIAAVPEPAGVLILVVVSMFAFGKRQPKRMAHP